MPALLLNSPLERKEREPDSSLLLLPLLVSTVFPLPVVGLEGMISAPAPGGVNAMRPLLLPSTCPLPQLLLLLSSSGTSSDESEAAAGWWWESVPDKVAEEEEANCSRMAGQSASEGHCCKGRQR